MLKEYHHAGKFSWPNNRRVAVGLTFDFQGGEDVRPGADGLLDHEEYTQAEYGPHTAIWRILRILEEEGVKATFNTCGGIAERYAAACKAIVAKGHEIAGHGYHHEVARELTREQETDVMKRTTAMIRGVTGRTPVGWRSCTQSPNSLELLMEHGYLFNSNSFSHDLPFLWESGGRVLVEIPGRPGRANTLRMIIRHMKKADSVWFATGSEIARWCLDEVFKVKSTQRLAAVS